ncbi:NAD-dependent epimerase/dehydratase family protein [Kitasatospora azatica]|uniref:NAD-dependent epimerase/dehydratase family protein n=1 Tax=Kitasatospora azatica TaxID=58347 RepID=UPI00056A13FA|nr:NAD(P)-dependent oxidoreductase [Kitasatospora azatica]
MKILFAGASGILGRKTTRELTAAGHQVAGLGRGAGNTLQADLLDPAAVLRAVDGLHFDVVIHAATGLSGKALTRHRDMAPTNELRTKGTVNLLAAARATGARRFVAESMMFGYGYGDHGTTPLAEDHAVFGPRGTNAWLERHVGAMRTKEKLTFTTEGIEGIALRFGLFYGAGVTDTLTVPMLRKRALPVVRERGTVLSWVDVDDAARALALAVEAGKPGEAYNIADNTPLSFAAHVRAAAEAFGTRPPRTVPSWLLRAAPLAHTVITTNLCLDPTKAHQDLGWTPEHPDGPTRLRELAAALANG